MKRIVLAASVATALLAGGVAANAANTPTPATSEADSAKTSGDLQNTNLSQHLQDQLSKAGYTAIKITPSSFFIQAKDKKGDPVAMIVGPDSFTEVTDVLQKPSTTTAQQTANKPTTVAPQK
jgi:hypothetical protein